jgi:hypothetical protein
MPKANRGARSEDERDERVFVAASNTLRELARREIRLDVEFLQRVDRQAILDDIDELRSERKKAEQLSEQLQKFN